MRIKIIVLLALLVLALLAIRQIESMPPYMDRVALKATVLNERPCRILWPWERGQWGAGLYNLNSCHRFEVALEDGRVVRFSDTFDAQPGDNTFVVESRGTILGLYHDFNMPAG